MNDNAEYFGIETQNYTFVSEETLQNIFPDVPSQRRATGSHRSDFTVGAFDVTLPNPPETDLRAAKTKMSALSK